MTYVIVDKFAPELFYTGSNLVELKFTSDISKAPKFFDMGYVSSYITANEINPLVKRVMDYRLTISKMEKI